jgi:hypothetical protein
MASRTGAKLAPTSSLPSKTARGLIGVGDRVRTGVRIPPKWKWPVGLSLSNEIGYQRRQYSVDTWTWAVRPIIDNQIGRWYLSFNPIFDKSIHGLTESQGFVFSPNVKVSYDFTKKITGGFECYGSLGPATDFDPIAQQQHQFSGYRPESFSQVGSEFRRWRRRDALHRSPDRQNDSRLSFRLLIRPSSLRYTL